MAHFFVQFMSKWDAPFEDVSFTVAKNTKKAVAEALLFLSETLKDSKVRKRIHVDATAVTSKEVLSPLVAYKFTMYRNRDTSNLSVVQITPCEAFRVSEVTAEDRHLLIQMARQGGNWDDLLKRQPGSDWCRINKALEEEERVFYERLQAALDSYKPYIEQAKNGSVELRDFKRRWHFRTRQTNLMELYRQCFNEVERVIHPFGCCNPNPSFQRGLVWSLEKKQAFILSILEEIPIGSFYINTDPEYDPELRLGEGYGSLLWDGKQRLHALDSFFKGEFPVWLNGQWVYFYEQPFFFYLKMQSSSIMVYESAFSTLREIIEAYVIINRSQVKHTDEDLQKAIDLLQDASQ